MACSIVLSNSLQTPGNVSICPKFREKCLAILTSVLRARVRSQNDAESSRGADLNEAFTVVGRRQMAKSNDKPHGNLRVLLLALVAFLFLVDEIRCEVYRSLQWSPDNAM